MNYYENVAVRALYNAGEDVFPILLVNELKEQEVFQDFPAKELLETLKEQHQRHVKDDEDRELVRQIVGVLEDAGKEESLLKLTRTYLEGEEWYK